MRAAFGWPSCVNIKEVDGMIRGKTRKILMLLLVAVFLVSGVKLALTLLEYKQGEDIYEVAAEEYILPQVTPPIPSETTEAAIKPEPMPPDIDFDSLKNINKDAVGWIWIGDSNISYPLVQGNDNARYLTRTYDGNYNILGSIFLDYRIPGDFSARNTVIYGHNMKNDAMFGTLEKYGDQAYYESHKEVFILTPEGPMKYEIFSAYVTDAYSDTYTMKFNNDDAYANYLNKMRSNSAIKTQVTVDPSDSIITLSTCTNSNIKTERFVVHAKKMQILL